MEELKNCVDKVIVVDDFRFVLDEKTGYYRCDKLRKRLHQYIWMKYNGEIPKGYHVHHKDHHKTNNHISNLMLIGHSKHTKHHMKERQLQEGYAEWVKTNLEKNARPKAIEWHQSEKGKTWHREKIEKQWKNNEEAINVCNHCNEEYKTTKMVMNKHKFCSNKCRSAWRRKEGLDDVERLCVICGNSFNANKYSKTKTCSKTCGAKLNHLNRKTP